MRSGLKPSLLVFLLTFGPMALCHLSADQQPLSMANGSFVLCTNLSISFQRGSCNDTLKYSNNFLYCSQGPTKNAAAMMPRRPGRNNNSMCFSSSQWVATYCRPFSDSSIMLCFACNKPGTMTALGCNPFCGVCKHTRLRPIVVGMKSWRRRSLERHFLTRSNRPVAGVNDVS